MATILSSICDGAPSEKNIVNEKALFNADAQQKEPIQLEVKGRIPAGVLGTLYRIGPGHYKIEDTVKGTYQTNHWFGGFSQVHRFQLIPTDHDTCKVLYNSRRQIDPLLDEIRKTGKLRGLSFGQKRDPCESFCNKLKTVFYRTPNTNVGVNISSNSSGLQILRNLKFEAERRKFMVLKNDANQYAEIDAETLEPMGVAQQNKIHSELKGPTLPPTHSMTLRQVICSTTTSSRHRRHVPGFPHLV